MFLLDWTVFQVGNPEIPCLRTEHLLVRQLKYKKSRDFFRILLILSDTLKRPVADEVAQVGQFIRVKVLYM